MYGCYVLRGTGLVYSGVRVSICATSFLWLQPRTKSTTFFIGAVSMAINNLI